MSLKNKEKSKGIVLLAFDTPEFSYTHVAGLCARLSSTILDLPVTLITDSDQPQKFKYDHVIKVDYSGKNSRIDFVTKKQVVWKNFNEFHFKEREEYSFNVIEQPLMRLAVQMSGYDYVPSKNMEHTFYENINEIYNIDVSVEEMSEEIDKQTKGISLLGKSMLNNFHPNENGHWYLSALIVDKFKIDGY